MISKIFLGLDPGSISGAIAWIITDKNNLIITINAQRFKDLTEPEIFHQLKKLKELVPDNAIFAVLEKVNVFPGQGIVSSGKFMRNYGMLEAWLISLEIPYQLKTSMTWIKSFGMKKNKTENQSQWKKKLKQRAQELFPLMKINTETADAILIAEFCRRINN